MAGIDIHLAGQRHLLVEMPDLCRGAGGIFLFPRARFRMRTADLQVPGTDFNFYLGRREAAEHSLDNDVLLLFFHHEFDRIYQLHLRQGGAGARLPVQLPMNRSDIGDYLGLTLETTSRAFSRLRRERVISTPDHHSVVIENPEALQLLAGVD